MNLLPIDFNKYAKEYAREMKNIEKYFKDNFSLPIYPIYGTLIGVLREGRFVRTDDDIDFAYLSAKHEEQEVIKEMEMIYDKLEKDGLLANRKDMIGQAWVLPPNKSMMADIWTSYIDESGKYFSVSMGKGEFHKDTVLPFVKGKLEDQEFLIPRNSEALLRLWYLNWEVPMDKSTCTPMKPQVRRFLTKKNK